MLIVLCLALWIAAALVVVYVLFGLTAECQQLREDLAKCKDALDDERSTIVVVRRQNEID